MLRMITTGFLMVLLCGCSVMDRAAPQIDGLLDDAVWQRIPARPLVQPNDRTIAGRVMQEAGQCRFYMADGMLYLAAEFDDSMLITAGEHDGDDLYDGDCCEIFIKPAGQPFYWEMWISPAELRSVVKWRKKDDLESQGHLIEGREMQAALTVRGTLNNGLADDTGWILEAAIPVPDISQSGAWDILIARQNYDESLSKETRELSSFPQLSKTSFHLTEEYFKLPRP